MTDEGVLRGSCHCGAVRFHLTAPIAEGYRCNCSLCHKKNAVMGQVHEDHFHLDSDWEALGLYQWNTKVARHYFCKTCGIYPFHKKRSAPEEYGINLAALDGFDIGSIPIEMRGDGKDMTVADPNPREIWTGPREGSGDDRPT